ncbi:hypothetical protein HFD88_000542 [Aspergillus terreus]|nr:hypothetical protein HFD88_000542 [Aspergillus terreus]
MTVTPKETSFASHLLSTLTAPNPPPTPRYSPADVPSIKKQAKRLSTTRLKQLLRAAERAHDDPPPPPGLGECCGSSCDPCVNDLWREELACWRERWGEGAVTEPETQKQREKMPGSFDW